ncbi:MAG: DNA recombination protein RmuC [Campylobacterales bacterium]|nr:DNA recombination protein RmuC [Campylobacterales bacterium]
MNNLFDRLQEDSTFLLIVGISLVVLLIIVLVVVVFSTKSKTLAERVAELKETLVEKEKKIELLELELKTLNIKNASNERELQQFAETKGILGSKEELLASIQAKYNELEIVQSETKTKLESLQTAHEKLLIEHAALQERSEILQEDNNKQKTNLARLLTKLESDTRHHAAKVEMMQANREQLKEEFEALARKVFEGNSAKFAEFSKQNIDNMIKPLQTQIDEFKKQVSQTYDIESQDRAVLKNEINTLKELNQKISQDAINLTNALKGKNKQQGVWGEMVLERVLEASGLRKGFEFEREVSLQTDDGNTLRPDVIVHLPDKRDLIIDAKTSLVAYERYVNAHEDEKAYYLGLHLESIRSHIDGLAQKNYERLREINTLDFIFMFMPIEGALAVALEHDNSIYDNAFKKKILLVGPTTLLVAMRAVENIWKYERQNQNAKEIARRAGAMYDKFVGFSEDLIKISKQIDTLQNSFHTAKNRLSEGKGNLVKQVQQLKELGAQTSKEIPKELEGEKS